MAPYLDGLFGNPSSIHFYGQQAKKGIETAREKVASLIGADPLEIVFTGGGTEADNMAIRGVLYTRRRTGCHIITSSVEHPAVIHTCQYLEKEGFQVSFLPVDKYGAVSPEEVQRAIRRDTILISIMHANHEVGTIQPIQEICTIAREHGILFHTDAIQSVGKIPVNVKSLGVDLLSISGHKIYGPKGIGALYIRKGIELDPFILGGPQEMNRRAGTENVLGIVGLGRAAEIIAGELEENRERLEFLRNLFWEGIKQRIPGCRLNGHPTHRLPNTLNVVFDSIPAESALISLDLLGVACSAGSACTSGSLEPSHVLFAMGLPKERARGAIRFSLGRDTTQDEIARAVEILAEVIDRLRGAGIGPERNEGRENE
jgi:cysteine desulfurase